MTKTQVISPTARAIDRANSQGRAALIAYLPVGYPSLASSIEAACGLIESGVNILELGLPYSDPVMDGPVIERAVTAALAAGFKVGHLFEAIETIGAMAPPGVPLLVMSYYNPILRRGVRRFALELAHAGAAGLVTPDLIVDEADPWIDESDRYGLDRVFLVAPSSSDQRLMRTVAACRGFTYAASTMGVTGRRQSLSKAAAVLAGRARQAGAKRVCVGLGVSTPEQAAQVASFADGVIVGSAFVARLNGGEQSGAIDELARDLVQAVQR